MESNSKDSTEHCIVLVRNIPVSFHSSDLRDFFSLLVEQDAFFCFHFRHRPEKIDVPEELTKNKHGSSKLSEDTTKNPPRTLCCFIKVYKSFMQELFSTYNGKNWVSDKNKLMSTRCHIIRVRMSRGLKTGTSGGSSSGQYLTRQERKLEQRYHLEHQNLQDKDFDAMIEMNPPGLMPQGNVGTPTKHFLDLIQRCQMPTSLIKKLGLRFPKGRRNRKYGQVELNYGGYVKVADDDDDESPEEASNGFMWFEKTQRELDDPEDTVPVEDRDDLDNDECEEWERHEALNDDVTTHERNKERLFEDEEEVVWEKGGPGIVWHMDANYWKEQAGGDDLDEATDDWDVDMSIYYEDEKDRPGDKDSRDFMQIRREKQMRTGNAPSIFGKSRTAHEPSATNTPEMDAKIGTFEKHTKGIGRKLLEKSGWKEGKGIGKWKEGISDALEGEGQMPYSKKGLGFYGQALIRHSGLKRNKEFSQISKQAMLEPGQGGIRITTCYDEQDSGDCLKRRATPTNLHYKSKTS